MIFTRTARCHAWDGYNPASMSDVPIIYNHNRPLPPLSLSGRIIAGVFAACSMTLLVIAARLHPDPAGVGTHHQLGLPPCGLLMVTGIPCMTCGMTTSYAELAHGHLIRSLIAQPAGTVLALLTAATFWIGSYIAVTGRPSARVLNSVPWARMLLTLLAIVLVAWVYKIVVVLHGHT